LGPKPSSVKNQRRGDGGEQTIALSNADPDQIDAAAPNR
jgi:hypothetical protein